MFSISILIGFRDHSLYKGHQVFLYKRAQIFVADLWGAFKGQNYGEFHDINSITIFADYIVPAVLRELGILKYGSNLSCSIDSNSEIVPGSEEEVEIRACSIYAVEKMRDLISKKFGKQVGTWTSSTWDFHAVFSDLQFGRVELIRYLINKLTFTNVTSHEKYHISKKLQFFFSLSIKLYIWLNHIRSFGLELTPLFGLASSRQLLSIDIDLWLWSCGVQNMALSHHRTLSIYYWGKNWDQTGIQPQHGAGAVVRDCGYSAGRVLSWFVRLNCNCHRCRKFCPLGIAQKVQGIVGSSHQDGWC